MGFNGKETPFEEGTDFDTRQILAYVETKETQLRCSSIRKNNFAFLLGIQTHQESAANIL